MKKKILIAILFMALFIPTSVVKAAYEGENSGENVAASGCETATTGWCMWDNNKFAMAKISVIFYDNGNIIETYGPIIVYNGSLSQRDISYVAETTGITPQYKAYWPSTSGSYSSIDAIVLEEGNIRDMLDSIQAGLYDQIDEKVKKKEPKETLRLGGAQGYRVIVEPIFKIKSNKTYGGSANKYNLGTLRELLGYLTVPSKINFGQKLFVSVDDVFTAVSCGTSSVYGSLSTNGGPGCGIGLYAPFGDAKETECKRTVDSDGCNTGKIQDPSFACIFTKESLSSEFFSEEYADVKNDYCVVACRDEIVYIYPNASGIREVLQGGFMVIGDSPYENLAGNVTIGQVQIRTKKVCRVTAKDSLKRGGGQIDLTTFNKDRMAAEQLLSKQYEEASVLSRLYKGVNSESVKCNSTPVCDDPNKSPYDYEMEWNNTPSLHVTYPTAQDYSAAKCGAAYTCTYSLDANVSSSELKAKLSITKSYSRGEYSKDKAVADIKEEAKERYTSAKNAYNKTSKSYQNILNQWNSCASASILKQFETEFTSAGVAIDYANVDKDGNVVYQYENELLQSGGVEPYDSWLKSFGWSTYATEIELPKEETSYSANISSASFGTFDKEGNFKALTPIKYGTNVAWWEWQQTKKVNFTLPENGYRYKTIPDGLYTRQTTNIKNYADIGFSVMPVSLTTPRGRTYYFSLKIQSLSGKLQTKFASLLPSASTNQCAYKVSCEDYIVDPRGELCKSISNDYCEDSSTPVPCGNIKIIYRTISLNEGEAFPGVSAKGRAPGENWSGDNPEKYIYNNRGVKGYAVYNLDPMYDIELTPSIIRQYRAYNRQANRKTGVSLNKNNSGIGILGYSDFESMICNVKNMGDYTCTSAFLRGGLNYGTTNTGSGPIVGGCAIKEGIGGYNNCGDKAIVNNKAWAMNILNEG